MTIEYVQLPLEEGLRSILGRFDADVQIEVVNATSPHQLIDIIGSDEATLQRINYTRVSTVEELLTEMSKFKETEVSPVVIVCELKLIIQNSVGLEYRKLNQKLVDALRVSRTSQMYVLESQDMPFIKMLCV